MLLPRLASRRDGYARVAPPRVVSRSRRRPSEWLSTGPLRRSDGLGPLPAVPDPGAVRLGWPTAVAIGAMPRKQESP